MAKGRGKRVGKKHRAKLKVVKGAVHHMGHKGGRKRHGGKRHKK